MLDPSYNGQQAAKIKAQQMIAAHNVLGRRDDASFTTSFTTLVVREAASVFFAGSDVFLVTFVSALDVTFFVGAGVVVFVAGAGVGVGVEVFFVGAGVVVVFFGSVGISPLKSGSRHLHRLGSLQFFIAVGPLQQSEIASEASTEPPLLFNLSQLQPALLLPASQLPSPCQSWFVHASLIRLDIVVVVVFSVVVVPGTLQMGSSPSVKTFKSLWSLKCISSPLT